jgi:hypothetical protein
MATKTTSKKLTPTEKQMIEKAATKALKFTKQKLTPEKRDEIFQAVEELKGSKGPWVKRPLRFGQRKSISRLLTGTSPVSRG